MCKIRHVRFRFFRDRFRYCLNIGKEMFELSSLVGSSCFRKTFKILCFSCLVGSRCPPMIALLYHTIFQNLFKSIKIFFCDHGDDGLNEVPDHDEIESQEESQRSTCLCQEGCCWVDVDLLWHWHSVRGEPKGQSCDVLRTRKIFRILINI